MKTYIEPSRTLDVIADVEVLVAGGGPSGLCAAVGAAKAGARVMIVENAGCFGGMWTNGLVITLGGYNTWLRPYRRVVDGVAGEWLRMAAALGGAEDNRSWVLSADPEVLKLTADRLIRQYGITPLLHTRVVEAVRDENGAVGGLVVENVDGRRAVTARVVIDCTGNADVAARAGAAFDIAGQLQPMTLPFFLADVDPSGPIPMEEELLIPMGPEAGYLGTEYMPYTSRRRDMDIDVDLLREAQSRGELPDAFGGPWFGGLRRHFPWVNTTRIYGSAVDAVELTAAEMQGREDVRRIADFYRARCKGFENAWVMTTGASIGIRETRRVRGVKRLTRDDIVSDTPVRPDSVALGCWPIDVHPPKGQSGAHNMYVPLAYGVPYGALVPESVDGLLVAGRCISCDREAMGTIRVGATCGAIGEAAGVAAALCAASGTAPRHLDVDTLRQTLANQNAIFE